MEALGWLGYEADRSELVLAQAYHSRLRARKAQLAEAGAADSHEDAGQATAQMQALMQYGTQLGYAFQSLDPQAHAVRQKVGKYPAEHLHPPYTAAPVPYASPPQPPPGTSSYGAPRSYSEPFPNFRSGGRH